MNIWMPFIESEYLVILKRIVNPLDNRFIALDVLFVGIVPNEDGRVSPGVYTAGWLGTGPRGVIIDTMNNAFKVIVIVLLITICSYF